MRPLLSPKDATTLLSIGSRKLWELTNRGEIPHLRIGRAIRYDPTDLEEWIERQKKRGHGRDDARIANAARSTSRVSQGDEGTHAVVKGVG